MYPRCALSHSFSTKQNPKSKPLTGHFVPVWLCKLYTAEFGHIESNKQPFPTVMFFSKQHFWSFFFKWGVRMCVAYTGISLRKERRSRRMSPARRVISFGTTRIARPFARQGGCFPWTILRWLIVHSYIYIYVYTYIRTYVSTYVHRYIDTYLHTYIDR